MDSLLLVCARDVLDKDSTEKDDSTIGSQKYPRPGQYIVFFIPSDAWVVCFHLRQDNIIARGPVAKRVHRKNAGALHLGLQGRVHRSPNEDKEDRKKKKIEDKDPDVHLPALRDDLLAIFTLQTLYEL